MEIKFRQGVYKPTNSNKYIGSNYPMYRSGWELKFFRWADTNENVVAWGSENIIIPYINPLDNKVHRYFVDNYVVFKDKEGNKKKFLIEIKPSKQVEKPSSRGNKKQSTVLHEQVTWVTNQAKWEAAKKWADKKGCQFIILTEKELGIR
jgi:hypothetical protein